MGDKLKKIIIVLFVVISCLVFTNEKEHILIPKNAIRFRVIANSNNKIDQKIKKEIKVNVQNEIYKIIKDVDNIEEARSLIKNNLKNVDKVLKKYDVKYDINYGNNYFPNKIYKGINYKAGNYESLVITLGEGEGQNWWCVLFPPLCLLDEKNNLDNVEYKLYVNKLINKFR